MTRVHTRLLAAVAVVGTVLLAGPARAEGETNIDHVQVSDEGVVSLVLAVDGVPGGAPVDAADLAVTVDGKPVEAAVESLAGSDIRRTTILALDASRSMAGERFEAAKSAAKAFLAAAPEDVHVGLLTFSGEVQDVISPTTDHDALVSAIDAIELTSGTHVYEAVAESVELAGPEGSRSVLLLSDGEDEGDGTPLGDAVAAATDSRVVVDVVAVQQTEESRALLAQIADASGGRVIAADDPAGLEELFAAQAQALAGQLLVTFDQPSGTEEEASISVALSTDAGTYTDTAFVALAGAADVPDLEVVEHGPSLVGDQGLLIGGAALALGLAGVLAMALLNAKGPSYAQQQVAYYTGQSVKEPRRKGEAEAGPSLRESAVSLAEQVVKGDFETRLAQRLAGAGLALTAAEWLLLHAGVAVVAGFVGFLLGGGPFLVVFLAVGVAVPWVYLRFKHGRRLSAFNAQLAETLQLIAGGLSAGLSLPQGIDTVVREGQEPMSGELRRALMEQRLGIEIEDALDGVAERMSSEDFSWVVMAIRIQREVGGNLAELLNTVADTLREREYLRRQVKVLTAEGRFSAWILGGLPIAMFLYMLVARRDFIRPLYTEPIGLAMSALAIVLVASGSFVLSKLVKVEV